MNEGTVSISKTLKWGALLVLAFVFSIVLRTQTVSAATYEVNVSKGYLALRTEPAYDSSNEIGELYTGDTVEVGEFRNLDYWYVYSPKYKCYGYVNADYLIPVSDSGAVGSEVVDTGYYSISSPSELDGLYEYKTEESDFSDYGKNLLVYDKASKKAGTGGFVFGIYMYGDNTSYEDLPEYELLGTMVPTNKPAKSYYVVVVYPTDVQYNSETEDTWRELNNSVKSILATFEADSAYYWHEN